LTSPPYDVGYGKPPVQTRFRKGQSGNPKGRGKGSRNFATVFMAAMSQSVTIAENGRRKRITKLDAAVTQLANDAARGDKKSIQLVFALLQVLEPRVEAQRLPKDIEPADEAVLAELKDRLLRISKGAAEADE
jgi:Family of unknown function (DUF5681)